MYQKTFQKGVHMLDIVWKNFLAFPASIWRDICSVFSSLYDPNVGFLENIYYSEFLWFLFLIVIMISAGGRPIMSSLAALSLFIVGHWTITFLGIVPFFVLNGILLLCIIFKKRTCFCIDVFWQILKYILLIVLGGTLLMMLFGSIGVILGFVIVAIYTITKLIKKFARRSNV